jgi:mono/diheme cytochrome c family protein
VAVSATPAPQTPAPDPAGEQRHAAGARVYADLCEFCHQDHGWGVDGVYPSLVESPLVLGEPEVAVRVILHGTTGPYGVMSPVGLTMKDQQIADVLTFIRREWGNEASPVAAEVVTAIRKDTASRTTPWSRAELAALTRVGAAGSAE